MYQLHLDPTTGSYCLRNGEKRTRWLKSIRSVLESEPYWPTRSTPSSHCILLYEGPTIPTLESNPELFL